MRNPVGEAFHISANFFVPLLSCFEVFPRFQFFSNVSLIKRLLKITHNATIQFYSPVDFKTLPVDCQIFIAHTVAMLYCLLLWQENYASKS